MSGDTFPDEDPEDYEPDPEYPSSDPETATCPEDDPEDDCEPEDSPPSSNCSVNDESLRVDGPHDIVFRRPSPPTIVDDNHMVTSVSLKKMFPPLPPSLPHQLNMLPTPSLHMDATIPPPSAIPPGPPYPPTSAGTILSGAANHTVPTNLPSIEPCRCGMAEDSYVCTPLDQHPMLIKYFKMLKVGLPKDMVGMKMTQDGFNSDLLQCDSKLPRPTHIPLQPIPSHDVANDNNNLVVDLGPVVPLNEHPIYGKFFKMLKVGLPKQNIESKLGLEGIDAAILNLSPSTLIAINDLQYHTLNAQKPASKPEPVKHKKKKLFLKQVESKNIGHDSLWADHGDDVNIDIRVDADEFNKLFVENSSEVQRRLHVLEEQRKNEWNKLKRIKVVQVISAKRAQNGAIAIARIKLSNEEIKQYVREINAEPFTTEQLKSLLEFLPTNEEKESLLKFTGNPLKELGPAERYMLCMVGFNDAAIFIQVMIFKQQFYHRWNDCKHKFGLLEATCDHIKSSLRLKKVLKAVLKIVNQLNDDPKEKCAGITVDSLLKLSNSKAFDKKTSVLQYIITVIYRHDQDVLLFPDDLKHLVDAAKLTLESINSERTALESELLQYLQGLHIIHRKFKSDGIDEKYSSRLQSTLNDFESNLKPMCHELSQRFLRFCSKFSTILRYFGEDPSLKCEGFFVPLHKFVNDFVTTRILVEKSIQLEAKKLQQQQRKANKLSTVKASIDTIVRKNVHNSDQLVVGNIIKSSEPVSSLPQSALRTGSRDIAAAISSAMEGRK